MRMPPKSDALLELRITKPFWLYRTPYRVMLICTVWYVQRYRMNEIVSASEEQRTMTSRRTVPCPSTSYSTLNSCPDRWMSVNLNIIQMLVRIKTLQWQRHCILYSSHITAYRVSLYQCPVIPLSLCLSVVIALCDLLMINRGRSIGLCKTLSHETKRQSLNGPNKIAKRTTADAGGGSPSCVYS